MNYEEIVEEIEAFRRNEIDLVINKLYDFLNSDPYDKNFEYLKYVKSVNKRIYLRSEYFDGLKDTNYISEMEYHAIFTCLLKIASYKNEIAKQQSEET